MARADEKHTPRIVNRRARANYAVLERFEAGIVLLGTEVKSIRSGNADLTSGFAMLEDGALVLCDVHIKPYEFGHQFNHEPRRPRRLLVHQQELKRLAGKLATKGCTLIPLALYFNRRGKIKVELGLCRGKQTYDKRETIRRRTAERETERALARRRNS
ncbi:MAG: SsrA-binding protein SmpB [Lentisphaerae bacterium]|nr:SsrA-binding protein SmpB [Lentisphaerota bacterium]